MASVSTFAILNYPPNRHSGDRSQGCFNSFSEYSSLLFTSSGISVLEVNTVNKYTSNELKEQLSSTSIHNFSKSVILQDTTKT